MEIFFSYYISEYYVTKKKAFKFVSFLFSLYVKILYFSTFVSLGVVGITRAINLQPCLPLCLVPNAAANQLPIRRRDGSDLIRKSSSPFKGESHCGSDQVAIYCRVKSIFSSALFSSVHSEF